MQGVRQRKTYESMELNILSKQKSNNKLSKNHWIQFFIFVFYYDILAAVTVQPFTFTCVEWRVETPPRENACQPFTSKNCRMSPSSLADVSPLTFIYSREEEKKTLWKAVHIAVCCFFVFINLFVHWKKWKCLRIEYGPVNRSQAKQLHTARQR